jgi:hypothetical protein
MQRRARSGSQRFIGAILGGLFGKTVRLDLPESFIIPALYTIINVWVIESDRMTLDNAFTVRIFTVPGLLILSVEGTGTTKFTSNRTGENSNEGDQNKGIFFREGGYRVAKQGQEEMNTTE